MKSATQSKTLWTFGATLAGAATALALHYTGAVVLDPATLGATISAAATAVVGVALRLVTTGPVCLPTSDERGVALLENIVWVAVMAAAVLIAVAALAQMAGCGHTFSGQTLELELAPSAPARLVVLVDSDEVLDARATGSASILVTCPAGSAPGYVGGKVACVGVE